MTQSISLFKTFQHSVAGLFFSALFQSIFANKFLMYLYLPLWIFPVPYFLIVFFYFDEKIYLVMITIYPSGSYILKYINKFLLWA